MHKHIPVLLHECVDLLDIQPGETFLDGTLGSGGHSAYIAEKFGDKVSIIGLDRDSDAVKRSQERLKALGAKFSLREASFRDLGRILDELQTPAVDAILLDLGISSDQLDASGRGFSFQRDEPLLMTMKEHPEESDLTAKEILNTFDEDTLEVILRGFGEERYSRKIARKIVEMRQEKPFETTFDLVEAIKLATPGFYGRGKIHPATRTFQALRIAVNEELTALEEGLGEGFERLKPGGRLAAISFHSLEDRLVKNFFRDQAKLSAGKLITKKPVTPTLEEANANPRSRSAKLRVIEKSV
jgi:16S rRNA (cytosine1402-N4)-methyltransferase